MAFCRTCDEYASTQPFSRSNSDLAVLIKEFYHGQLPRLLCAELLFIRLLQSFYVNFIHLKHSHHDSF
jgi:hypothetical protein